MSWKKWTFIKPKGTQVEIEGETLTFYPICISSFFNLEVMAAPIAKALSMIFQNEDNDVGITDRTEGAGVEDGSFKTEKVVAPVSLELARFRLDQRKAALEDAFRVLFDRSNIRAVVRLLMDSLRDEFDRKKNEDEKNAEADEFIADVDGILFRKLLIGLYEGNKKVFGPLANTVAHFKKMMDQKMRGLDDLDDSENEINDNSEKSETPTG